MQENKSYALIEAPSNLGLRDAGVEGLPEALVHAGLLRKLGAARAATVPPGKHHSVRDFDTLLLNPEGVANYARSLALAVERVLRLKKFPIVAGGDRSTLLGSLLALKRRGRYGLLLLSGHASFYQPSANPTGEIVLSTLALATGRGPHELTRLEQGEREPLIRDEDVVLLGFRDDVQTAQARCQWLSPDMTAIDLATVRRSGIEACLARSLERLALAAPDGYWIHFDADVLDDREVPAVNHRLIGGLSWDEAEFALHYAMRTGRAVGLQVTSLNPSLDTGGFLVRSLTQLLVRALEPTGGELQTASSSVDENSSAK